MAMVAERRARDLFLPEIPIQPTLASELPIGHRIYEGRELIFGEMSASGPDSFGDVGTDGFPSGGFDPIITGIDISLTFRCQPTASHETLYGAAQFRPTELS